MCEDNKFIPDKPFFTFEQQLENLSSKNIVYTNKSTALKILKTVSYYTVVNGCKSAFTKTQSFPNPVEIEELYSLHIISSVLCSIYLQNILHIECTFKTMLSYVVSKNFGVEADLNADYSPTSSGYLSTSHYLKKRGIRDSTLKRIWDYAKKHPSSSTIHYMNTKNHVPPWILCNNISLGSSINWYSILPEYAKNEIIDDFFAEYPFAQEARKELFIISLDLLREFRNCFAHNARVIGVTSKRELSAPYVDKLTDGLITNRMFSKGFGRNDITALTIAICCLLNEKYLYQTFQASLSQLLSTYSQILICGKTILEIFHMPENIFDIVQTIYEMRFD